jgi:hypothetical protein
MALVVDCGRLGESVSLCSKGRVAGVVSGQLSALWQFALDVNRSFK